MDDLAMMVEQALRRWPKLAYLSKPGNRARSAAALVREERVRQLGNGWWEVNDHRCTAAMCDCEDRAPLDEQGGKMCKHCLAVRMVIRLRGNALLSARLDEISAAAGGAPFALLVDRDYDQRTRVLVGYRCRGRDVRWPVGECCVVTFEQISAAMLGRGWSLADLPRKGRRWEYYFAICVDGAGAPLTAAIWNLKGVTDATLERRRNDRLADWAAQELAGGAPAGKVQTY